MKSLVIRLKGRLGIKLALTLCGDGIWLGALVAAPFVPILVWCVLAGQLVILVAVTTLARLARPGPQTDSDLDLLPVDSAQGKSSELPWLWFLLVVVVPVSSCAAVYLGIWRVTPGRRMRFRIGITVLVLALAGAAANQNLDRYLASVGLAEVENDARDYLTESLKKASLTLLVARGLDGVISVVKTFSISAVAGVAPGEVLDPVDDLVERFSLVMWVSTASLTAQLLLLEVGSTLGLTIFLTVALAVVLAAVWIPQPHFATRLYDLGTKLVLLALVVRIGIPAAAVIGSSVASRFLLSAYEQSSAGLSRTATELETGAGQISRSSSKQADPSLLERLGRVTGSVATVSVKDLKDKLQALEAKVTELSDHLVRLLAIFVLETILFPLSVAWGLLKLLNILGRPTGAKEAI